MVTERDHAQPTGDHPGVRATRPTKVSVAGSLIDPSDLDRLVDAARAAADSSGLDLATPPPARYVSPYEIIHGSSQRLKRLSVAAGGFPVPEGRGPSSRMRRFIKRLALKSTRWYIEPRFAAQHELNQELRTLTAALADAMLATHHDLVVAQQQIEQLRRDVQRIAAALDASAHRPTTPSPTTKLTAT